MYNLRIHLVHCMCSYVITWVCIMRRRIDVRAVRYISLKFRYFSNFASIVQLVPAYRITI
jgi:exoribonuclease II